MNYDKDTQVCYTDTGTGDFRTVRINQQGNGKSVFRSGNAVLCGSGNNPVIRVCKQKDHYKG